MRLLTCPLLVLSLAACAPVSTTSGGANAVVSGVAGNGVTGALHFAPDGNGVRVTGAIRGLAPGSTHGFHLHALGNCGDPANGSTDGHFNPGNQPHGGPVAPMRHAGDLPNLVAGADGVATVDARLPDVAIDSGAATDLVGKAAVVHAGRDDYVTQPAGGAGTPIACGVIALP
jgi:Cu-Zn family superoxide dismutase